MKVAVIGGAGKMGRWLVGFLARDGHQVVAADVNTEGLRRGKGKAAVDIMSTAEAVEAADVVLISVPMDSFDEVVEEIGHYVRPGQIIMDVTSVKVAPVEAMHRYIKEGVVLGAHPMFGPGAGGIGNKNIVLTPTNGEETALAQRVKEYLEARRARVTLMSPSEHDEMMAIVLGLPSFVALVSADTLLGLGKMGQARAVSGSTHRLLLMLAESVVSEGSELYASLQMRLPNMEEVEEVFRGASREWAGLVRRRDRQGFIERVQALKARLAEADPDFGKAYEDMYRLLEGLEDRTA